MNYAYARVSAKDRTYSGRLPRLVSSALKKPHFLLEEKRHKSVPRQQIRRDSPYSERRWGMERNFVTLHASVHPVHDVIMTGVQSLRFRQKSGTSQCRFFWRKRRDSNPRGLSPKRFSRPPRYDHFATLPIFILNFCLYPAVSQPFTV